MMWTTKFVPESSAVLGGDMERPRGKGGARWVQTPLVVLAVALLPAACQMGQVASRGEQGPYRVVRFVEDQGGGNIAMVSEDAEGGLSVSRSSLAAWKGGGLWLLGRGRLLSFDEGVGAQAVSVCAGAAALLVVGGNVLVSCPGQGRVEVRDRESLAPVQTLDVCKGASQMAASSSGRTVFVRCRDGLAILAGWLSSPSREAERSLLLWSRPEGGLTALSEEGLFRWSYPDMPEVASWDVMAPGRRDLVAVGRRVSVNSDLDVQGDAEFSVTLEMVVVHFGADWNDVSADDKSLKVLSLARSGLGDASWDPVQGRLLVPLPGSHEIVSVSAGCLAETEGHPVVRSACGTVSRLEGSPGAVIVPGKGCQVGEILVWDRVSETLWRGDGGGFSRVQVFASHH